MIKRKTSVVSICVLLLAAIIILDISGNYNEVYAVDGFSSKVFVLDSGGKLKEVTDFLNNGRTKSSHKNSVILAIKLNYKFFSKRHEFFWETFLNHRPDGYAGSTDSISSIKIVHLNGKVLPNNSLGDASAFANFRFDESINQDDYFFKSYNSEAATFSSVDEFKTFYNSNGYKVGFLNKFIFFSVDSTLSIGTLKTLSIELKFSDKNF